MADHTPDENSSSQQNSNSSPDIPRIAAPEGARLARGQSFSGEKEKTGEESEVPVLPVAGAPFEIEVGEKTLWDVPDEDNPDYAWDEQPMEPETVETVPLAKAPVPPVKDQEMGLLEHLAELRTRLLYCVIAVLAMGAITWQKTPEIQTWFARPILKALQSNKAPGTPGLTAPQTPNEIIMTDPMGGFTIFLQISLISALLLTMPFLLFQVWRFIEPALTNNERKYTLVLVPFSSALFFLGAGLGYAVSPMFYQFFLQFQPPGVSAKWDYYQSVILMAKMLLVFGVAFQVPVVTIFLNKTGLVSRNMLIEYWRHAVVMIFIVVAILTPTWDPLTLAVCAGPPCLLYFLSIWIVKWL